MSDRYRRGLKDAELQKGPTSGTLRPQQAELGDGSGATPPDTTRIKVGYAHRCATDAESVPTWQEQAPIPQSTKRGQGHAVDDTGFVT